jgi:LmbE family N-acetylglucosaminyl deacetylase
MVVFEPHPDDADFWTGGLTLLLGGMGWKAHYVCAGPAGSREREDALASAAILGVTRRFLEIPLRDNANLRGDLLRAVPPLLRETGARLVFIPPLTDYHREHVLLSRELFSLFHWSAGQGLGEREVYAYDSHENREPVEIYVDISSVWAAHVRSLRCHRAFERPTIPDNTLIRVKTGRAMLLGASVPAQPVHYAEGYRLLQGSARRISSLPEILGERFYYRAAEGLVNL